MDKFLIFADGRTGSSNLAKILRKLHGDVSLEPFNGKYGVNKAVEDCISNFMSDLNNSNDLIGVKHISAQLSHLFNLRLIKGFDKIVFLYRENVLQQAISWAISQKTGDWYNKERIMSSLHKAKDVGYNDVINLVNSIVGRRDVYKGYFEDSNHLVVKYEDLYNNKVDELNRVLNYLGYPDYDLHDEEVNHMLFSAKINSTESYKTLKCYPQLKMIGSKLIGNLE